MNNNELRKQIKLIEKKEKTLLNNINLDKLTMIDAKEAELKNASSDRAKILTKQIKDAREEIILNEEIVREKSNKDKIAIIKNSLSKMLEHTNSIIISLDEKISSISNELSETKNKLVSSDEVSSISLIKDVEKLCYLVIKARECAKKYSELKLSISKALECDDFEQLLDYYSKIENEFDDFSTEVFAKPETINDSDSVSIKKATELVDKLEKSLSEEELENAKKALSMLANSEDKNKLAQRITTCEGKIESEKLKTASVCEITALLDEAESKSDSNKLQEAFTKIVALLDCPEKEHLIERYNLVKFVILISESENKIKNSDEFIYDDVKNLVDIYRTFSDDNKDKYEMRLNKLIAMSNEKEQLQYQDSIINNNIEKYGFLERFSEFLSGVVWNKIISSKLYTKIALASLKKAENKDNIKKINKNKFKLSKVGIVNGYRLFKKRNVIAKLKAKLYSYDINGVDEESKEYKASKSAYDRAVDFATDEVSRKLNEYSEKEHIMKNKDAVVNMIRQYLDTLAITNDLEDMYNKVTDFIDEAKEKGIIEDYEWAAYICEANNINGFRNRRDNQLYETSSDDLDNEIKYYDSDSLSDRLLYLKKSQNN